MPSTPQGFAVRIESLTAALVEQGRRVQMLVDAAFEAVFTRNAERAKLIGIQDDAIDQADVALERGAVQLLTDATGEGAQLAPEQLRWLLTVVKLNNELERVADAAVDVAALVEPLRRLSAPFPETFPVIANSVIGILRDVNAAIQRADAALAKVVLQSQHAVWAFKAAVLRDLEKALADGRIHADFAFNLHEIATICEIIADHCANMAEQIIYAVSGTIVRHEATRWVEVPRPATG